MVICADCGAEVQKAPEWLSTVNVRFVCDECRQKHPKPTLAPDFDIDLSPKRKTDDLEEEGAEILSLEEITENEDEVGFGVDSDIEATD